MDYVILYEFDPEFLDYLVDGGFGDELTMTKSIKATMNRSLDERLGEQPEYWSLWEQEVDDTDDVAEVFGQLSGGCRDDVVEVYSPPRIVQEAQRRGLRAESRLRVSRRPPKVKSIS